MIVISYDPSYIIITQQQYLLKVESPLSLETVPGLISFEPIWHAPIGGPIAFLLDSIPNSDMYLTDRVWTTLGLSPILEFNQDFCNYRWWIPMRSSSCNNIKINIWRKSILLMYNIILCINKIDFHNIFT